MIQKHKTFIIKGGGNNSENRSFQRTDSSWNLAIYNDDVKHKRRWIWQWQPGLFVSLAWKDCFKSKTYTGAEVA